MTENQQKQWKDIGLSSGLLIISIIVFIQAVKLGPARFDLLGAAFLPKLLSVGIAVLSLVILVNAVIKLAQATPPDTIGEETPEPEDLNAESPFVRRPSMAVFVVVLTALYILVMSQKWLHYLSATIAFITVAAVTMSFFEKTPNWYIRIAVIVTTALILGFGLEYLFTKVLVINLP